MREEHKAIRASPQSIPDRLRGEQMSAAIAWMGRSYTFHLQSAA